MSVNAQADGHDDVAGAPAHPVRVVEKRHPRERFVEADPEDPLPDRLRRFLFDRAAYHRGHVGGGHGQRRDVAKLDARFISDLQPCRRGQRHIDNHRVARDGVGRQRDGAHREMRAVPDVLARRRRARRRREVGDEPRVSVALHPVGQRGRRIEVRPCARDDPVLHRWTWRRVRGAAHAQRRHHFVRRASIPRRGRFLPSPQDIGKLGIARRLLELDRRRLGKESCFVDERVDARSARDTS